MNITEFEQRVIEFLNIQNDSGGNRNNHIHSAWRRIKGDPHHISSPWFTAAEYYMIALVTATSADSLEP